jgi:hAT family C-terminal dimerisation region
MLILDVKTRWSSTHQMLRELKLIVSSALSEIWAGRALDYREAIDSFVAKTRDLRAFELALSDWDAVILITGWLKSFRSATTQMSTTKHATLSFTHAIFRGLQESVRQSLRDLPADCEPLLKQSILLAHRKLSDYYYKFDESPLYIWASSRSLSRFLHERLNFLAVLDPRIMFDGLLADCHMDDDAISYLRRARTSLKAFYDENYSTLALPSTAPSTPPRRFALASESPQKVDFTSRYANTATVVNEFDAFLKLPQENFNKCDPIKWWAARGSQFPTLSLLAKDILSIPGRITVLGML